MQQHIVDALAGRAGLRGLQAVLLAPPAHALVGRALENLLTPAYALEACSLTRAKWKPGRKLTAYYDVVVRRPHPEARVTRPVAVTWTLHEIDQSATAPPDLETLEAEALRQGLAAPFKRLMAHVPVDGLHIQVAPLDARFPQLLRLSHPQYVRDLLASVYTERAPALSAACTVTPVRYRPRQRHVLRYDPQPPDEHAPVFAKLYAGDRAAHIFRILTQLADWLAFHSDRVTPIPPLAHHAPDAVVLYPQLAGRPFSHDLARGRIVAAVDLRHTGAALHTLHTAPSSIIDGLAQRDLAAEIAAITRACEHIDALLPAAGAAIHDIVQRAQAMHEHVPHESPTFTHGDFKTDHVWATSPQLTLIDFDTCAIADPASDIGKFLADLRWWYAASDRPDVEQAQAHFLAGYAAAGGSPARIARARLYEVLWLVKLTARRVRLFDANWATRTHQMIEHATALMQVCAHNAAPAPVIAANG